MERGEPVDGPAEDPVPISPRGSSTVGSRSASLRGPPTASRELGRSKRSSSPDRRRRPRRAGGGRPRASVPSRSPPPTRTHRRAGMAEGKAPRSGPAMMTPRYVRRSILVPADLVAERDVRQQVPGPAPPDRWLHRLGQEVRRRTRDREVGREPRPLRQEGRRRRDRDRPEEFRRASAPSSATEGHRSDRSRLGRPSSP